jgi:hypothetical protein
MVIIHCNLNNMEDCFDVLILQELPVHHAETLNENEWMDSFLRQLAKECDG